MMRRKPVEEWFGTTGTTCLLDWAEAYLDFAKAQFSEKTYKEKKSMFRRFFKVVNPNQQVSDLTPAMVLDYILLQKKNRSGYGANKDRKNLVAAWNWGTEYLTPVLHKPNPCLVRKMSEIRSPRYVPPEQDFWKIYDIAKGQDQVMLLTFLHLAGRRGEIFRMTWSDVDFINSRVRLWTRKRMDGAYEYDWLPMTKELRKLLLWWWENRPIKDKPNVFLCLDKTPFTREYYGQPYKHRLRFMRRLCDKAEVKPFGFHAIRHMTASTLFNQGYDLGVIQALLRHKSPSTTERYLKSIGMERVRDALESLPSKSAEVVPIDQVYERMFGK